MKLKISGKWTEWPKFFANLAKWSDNGCSTFGNGGVCFGHTPWDGPFAYLHELYEPLVDGEIKEIEQSLGRFVPSALKEFYRCANGCSIFGVVALRGHVGLANRRVSSDLRFPVSLRYGNVDERPAGLHASEFVFGGVIGESIVGQLVMPESGEVKLVHPSAGTDVAVTWSSFNEFIFSEISRLDAMHDASGRFVASERERLPLDARRWES